MNYQKGDHLEIFYVWIVGTVLKVEGIISVPQIIDPLLKIN
jgi:hypothetical protein